MTGVVEGNEYACGALPGFRWRVRVQERGDNGRVLVVPLSDQGEPDGKPFWSHEVVCTVPWEGELAFRREREARMARWDDPSRAERVAAAFRGIKQAPEGMTDLGDYVFRRLRSGGTVELTGSMIAAVADRISRLSRELPLVD